MRPLKIAIDASRTTVSKATGTEYYARQLIHHLIQLNESFDTPPHLMLYFRDPPPSDLFPSSANVSYRIIPFQRLWTHIRFALAIWRDRPDVTFVPAHTLPLLFPGKAVVTVHDLGFKYFPQAHPTLQRWYLDWTTKFSGWRATEILADSQATAADLQKFYRVQHQKIQVVYPGVEPPKQHGGIQTIRKKYNLPERYFLFIGTLQPRKNIVRIVTAFHQWQERYSDSTVGLVLAGQKGWLYDENWLQHVDSVVVTGYVDDADKGEIIASAEALVFPSLYEGFGFPVIEAMYCHTPVIASNSSSLPELVGDAGILVDPLDIDAIAEAMQTALVDMPLRQQLIDRGGEQAKKFDWQTAAEQTMQILEHVGGGSK